jgi:hypothetical protein
METAKTVKKYGSTYRKILAALNDPDPDRKQGYAKDLQKTSEVICSHLWTNHPTPQRSIATRNIK